MDLIKMARELGKAIQASEEYKHLVTAKEANDGDEELQDMIKEFNLIRMNLSTEMQMKEQNADKIQELDQKLKETYTAVMGRPTMLDFNEAKQDIDALMNEITGILMLCVNGEDPDTCEVQPAGCSGSCSSCSGCH